MPKLVASSGFNKGINLIDYSTLAILKKLGGGCLIGVGHKIEVLCTLNIFYLQSHKDNNNLSLFIPKEVNCVLIF